MDSCLEVLDPARLALPKLVEVLGAGFEEEDFESIGRPPSGPPAILARPGLVATPDPVGLAVGDPVHGLGLPVGLPQVHLDVRAVDHLVRRRPTLRYTS